MRISDWSSDVCSSDLGHDGVRVGAAGADRRRGEPVGIDQGERHGRGAVTQPRDADPGGICKAPGNRKINARKDCRHDRKSVVEGKSVSVSVDLGGRRILNKKKYRIKI